MKHNIGNRISPFKLPAIDDSLFDLDSMKGERYLLSFFRFAACPFCNLRIHELTKHYDEFGGNLKIVALFDSPLDNLKRYAQKHHAPFPILADEKNIAYKQYSIEHSIYGVLRGMIVRMPDLLYSMFAKGNIPYIFKGSLTTMPADFLVDENGIIQTAYYAKDEGDHLDFDTLKDFAFKRGGFAEKTLSESPV